MTASEKIPKILTDPKIKPIIEFKESSDEKPSWQDITPFYPTMKRYWALWEWQLKLPKTTVSTVHGNPTGGHFGVMKTLQKVPECFYWNNVRRDVEKCCRLCDSCAARKGPRKRTRGRLQLYNPFVGSGKITSHLQDPSYKIRLEQKKQKFRPYSISSSANRRIFLKKKKGCTASFQVKKCAVPDDVRLASVGKHMPKKASNYRRCWKCLHKKENKRGPAASVQNVMYPCTLEHASHLFMPNNHH
ncbi:retrovirus-related Pol polyprotein from transposon 412 [Trichonephila clavipes]|nr:retrovirus-related Pol polyprotein from transposon 412 [Trichonephila clavipes]